MRSRVSCVVCGSCHRFQERSATSRNQREGEENRKEIANCMESVTCGSLGFHSVCLGESVSHDLRCTCKKVVFVWLCVREREMRTCVTFRGGEENDWNRVTRVCVREMQDLMLHMTTSPSSVHGTDDRLTNGMFVLEFV